MMAQINICKHVKMYYVSVYKEAIKIPVVITKLVRTMESGIT